MSEAFMTRANEVLAKYPTLHTGGFHDKDRSDHWDFNRLEKITKFIEVNYMPSRTKRGSYGLKHEIEDKKWTDESNTYVSNGEGIVAMICAGYEPKDICASLNCTFSVDTKYFTKLGEKKAKKIWKKSYMHSRQYEYAVQEEERLKQGAWWHRLLFREAYEETKKDQLAWKCILCMNCLPAEDKEPMKQCKSVHSKGVIHFHQRGQILEPPVVVPV